MDEFDDDLFNDYDFDVTPATTTTTPLPPLSTEPAEAEDTTVKVKKVKLDEKLLLDTKGIPLLRNESRYLQFKGKNHEAEDLKKLMTYYTVWANNLYPKYKFSDFAKRVGPHASHRLVRDMIKEWQEEYKVKLQERRNVENELSGRTVGDDDGIEQEESSEDEVDRPLFIPFSEGSKPKETTKKVQRPVNKRRTDSDDEEMTTKEPRTITFSDDDDEETNKPSVKSGRAYALAILAEKRKKRKLAQRKAQEDEEEEEEEEEVVEKVVAEKKKEPLKSVDDIMGEYYEDEIELALSDNELSSLQISSQEQKSTDDIEMVDI